MATEKTIIKDSKSNGGIVGLTRKKSALIRWNITLAKKNGSIERTELKCIDHIPFLSALIFWSIILAASRNMSQSLNHTLTCFITSIGKLWGDGGLADLLVGSGVYAACTVEQMLSGKLQNLSLLLELLSP
jgi:hypothetical protein